jgi:hypothetical protein
MTRALISTLLPLVAAGAPALAKTEKLSKVAPPPLSVCVESETGTTRVPTFHPMAFPQGSKTRQVLSGSLPVDVRAKGRTYVIRAGLGFPL